MTQKYTKVALAILVLTTACSQKNVHATNGCAAKLRACLKKMCGRNSAPVSLQEKHGTDAVMAPQSGAAAGSSVVATEHAIAAQNTGTGNISISTREQHPAPREAWATPPARRLPRVSMATDEAMEQAIEDATSPHTPALAIATPPPAGALTTEAGEEFSKERKARLIEAIEQRKAHVQQLNTLFTCMTEETVRATLGIIKSDTEKTLLLEPESLQGTCAKLDRACIKLAEKELAKGSTLSRIKDLLSENYEKHLQRLTTLQILCRA